MKVSRIIPVLVLVVIVVAFAFGRTYLCKRGHFPPMPQSEFSTVRQVETRFGPPVSTVRMSLAAAKRTVRNGDQLAKFEASMLPEAGVTVMVWQKKCLWSVTDEMTIVAKGATGEILLADTNLVFY